MEERLYQYIEDNMSLIIDDLDKLVAIESVSDNMENVSKALRLVIARAKEMGLNAYTVLDDQVGVVEMGDGDETLGILTHVDVVDPGELNLWKTNPFKLTKIGNKLFGRGTLDDKGMVIANLYAMKAVKELDIPMYKKTQMIIGTQEESQWVDMEKYVRHYPIPDYGFTPDGEHPICNIEKGCIDLEMAFKLGEKDAIVKMKAGNASNSIPGNASITFRSEIKVSVLGKSVHSCYPERGENAIFLLAEELEKKQGTLSEKYSKQGVNLIIEIKNTFKDIYGHKLELAVESDKYNGELVGEVTLVPTTMFIEDGIARVHINGRFPYGVDPDDIVHRLNLFAKENGGSLTNVTIMPSVYVPKDKPFLKKFASAYEKITGQKHKFALAYGGSYAKALPNTVSWGPIFPEDEDVCHEENEYITVESLMKNTKLYSKAILDVVTDSNSLK